MIVEGKHLFKAFTHLIVSTPTKDMRLYKNTIVQDIEDRQSSAENTGLVPFLERV